MALFRKTCSKCHSKAIAKKHGLKSLTEVVAKKAGMTVAEYAFAGLKKRAAKKGMSVKKFIAWQHHMTAIKAGYNNYTDYQNSKHRYRQHRETYCENIDGRLGFVCTTNIVDSSMLEVDHVNNNHKDDSKGNHQTLCRCCHAYKSRYFSDYTDLKYIKKIFTDNIVNHFESL